MYRHFYGLAKKLFVVFPCNTLQYSVPCTKYDRHGYKPRERLLVITTGALYLLEAKENKIKQKHRFSLKEIQGLHVSPNSDNLMLIQIPPENAKKEKVSVFFRCSCIVSI